MYESKILPSQELTRHVVFDRDIFRLEDGSLMAGVYNGANGCFLLTDHASGAILKSQWFRNPHDPLLRGSGTIWLPCSGIGHPEPHFH